MPHRDLNKQRIYRRKWYALNRESINKKRNEKRHENLAEARAKNKIYREENREELNKKQRDWRKKNLKKAKAREMRYFVKHRDRRLLTYRNYHAKIKEKVFKAYSGEEIKCKCCNENRMIFLSIDHMNNDGYKHRKEIGKGNLYNWLIKNNYPTGFQVLCMNCQFGRKHNNGVCIHELERAELLKAREVNQELLKASAIDVTKIP